jgi:hypothetical protein
MKVELDKSGLIVIPETEFEEAYISKTFDSNTILCYIKRGLTASEIIGLKICDPTIKYPEVIDKTNSIQKDCIDCKSYTKAREDTCDTCDICKDFSKYEK